MTEYKTPPIPGSRGEADAREDLRVWQEMLRKNTSSSRISCAKENRLFMASQRPGYSLLKDGRLVSWEPPEGHFVVTFNKEPEQ